MEVSRRHDPFDTRWPCVRNESSGAMSTVPVRTAEMQGRDWRTSADPWPPGLSLVPTEPVSATAAIELESEEAGARRLLAAVDARRAQSGSPVDQL